LGYLAALLGLLCAALALLLVKAYRDVNRAIDESETCIDGGSRERVNPDTSATDLGRRVRILLGEILADGREKRSIGAIAAGSMTHDFRTPIARISSKIEAALRDSSIDKFDVLEYTLDQLRQHRLVFDRLLTFVKLDAPGAKLPQTETNLSALIALLCEDYELIFEDEGIALNSVVEPGIVIDGNQEMLQLTLVNLFENIRKYASSSDRVDVSLRRYGRHCSLTVRDYGPGLPSAQTDQASQRFWQEKKESSMGFGLGLALVQEITTLHDGQLEMTNAQPGLLVTIRIPLRADSVDGRS